MNLRDSLLFVLCELEKCGESLSSDKAWNIHSIIQDVANSEKISGIDVDFSSEVLNVLCDMAAKDAIDDAKDFG